VSRRILVTGGAGFIGSHVADAFLAVGDAVTVVDDFSSGRRENVPGGVEMVEADVRAPQVLQRIASGEFDVICHLAAQIDVRKSVADPVDDAARNILASLGLLEAMRQSPRRARLVFSSTGGAVYGDFITPPAAEPEPKDPESPYGIAKLSVEYYMAYYARVHGLDTIALRYANVYGPRQDPHGEAGVVAIFCQRILGGQALTVFGDGAQTRDYVFVGDVAAANVCAASAAVPAARKLDSRAFNIGTGVPTSVNALAAAIQQAAGSSVPVEFGAARPGEQQRSWVSIAKAREGLGWSPAVSLNDGLQMTYRWFAERARAAAPTDARPRMRAHA